MIKKNKTMKLIFLFSILPLALLLSACQSHQPKQMPEIVPAVEVKKPIKKHALGIIGQVEPVYVLPMKSPIAARIDTGAETSSIDADNIKPFERDGEKWVSFEVINRTNGEKYHFEKPVRKVTEIVRINEHEKRYVVDMNIKMGSVMMSNVQFTLAQRDKFTYQVLVGRNILTGRAIVDTALSNTLN